MSPDATGALLVGRGLDRADGERLEFARKPSSLRDLLLARQRDDAPDQWVILGEFEQHRRSRDGWRSASGVTLDLDWEDPTVPKEEGAHQAVPAGERELILAALDEYSAPGLAYLTPRGLRVMHLLAADVTDVDGYEELVDAASEMLLRHLGTHGVPLWRDGVTGLRLDGASRSPWQAMRLPLPGQPTVLTGGDCEVCGTGFEAGHTQRMDLDAALPPDLAEACRQIASWVQIAAEVVVTGLMATASAAIGNTRWVVARGRAVPVSLQYLTSLPSGSGKGEVRKYLRLAAQDFEREVTERRGEARREREEHQDKLEQWRADGRSSKNRAKRGPRPELPPLSPEGGERTSFIVSEANLEGIIATLEDTPRGVLWASDEAHEIVGMLGRYGDGGGARSLDAARLRRLMDSAPVEAHRARSNSSPVRRLPRPCLAIDADVQPKVLDALFNDEDRVSGTTARFLMHAPPPMQGERRYVDAPPEPEPWVLELLRSRLGALWAIELKLKEGVPHYEPLPLEDKAERLWAEELERLERRYPGAGDEETGALGHARGRMLRLAGVLTLLRDPKASAVTVVDMRRAITHMRYHLEHHRVLIAQVDEDAEAERLEKLCEQVEKLFKSQPETGVRATDLRRHVSKSRYGGKEGLRRAYADLHALGWKLRRRRALDGRPGRPPVPAFLPPEGGLHDPHGPEQSSHKPHKPAPGGLGGLRDDREGRREHAHHNGADACELLDRASDHLIASGAVGLPRPGVRTACPACGSPDGLGVLPDKPSRWHCHSDRHTGHRGGCAVDYYLAQRLERMPTVAEAVEEAKGILGLNGEAGSPADAGGAADEVAP